jgi:hypothetical protein
MPTSKAPRSSLQWVGAAFGSPIGVGRSRSATTPLPSTAKRWPSRGFQWSLVPKPVRVPMAAALPRVLTVASGPSAQPRPKAANTSLGSSSHPGCSETSQLSQIWPSGHGIAPSVSPTSSLSAPSSPPSIGLVASPRPVSGAPSSSSSPGSAAQPSAAARPNGPRIDSVRDPCACMPSLPPPAKERLLGPRPRFPARSPRGREPGGRQWEQPIWGVRTMGTMRARTTGLTTVACTLMAACVGCGGAGEGRGGAGGEGSGIGTITAGGDDTGAGSSDGAGLDTGAEGNADGPAATKFDMGLQPDISLGVWRWGGGGGRGLLVHLDRQQQREHGVEDQHRDAGRGGPLHHAPRQPTATRRARR